MHVYKYILLVQSLIIVCSYQYQTVDSTTPHLLIINSEAWENHGRVELNDKDKNQLKIDKITIKKACTKIQNQSPLHQQVVAAT
jgi:hypothetical protein